MKIFKNVNIRPVKNNREKLRNVRKEKSEKIIRNFGTKYWRDGMLNLAQTIFSIFSTNMNEDGLASDKQFFRSPTNQALTIIKFRTLLINYLPN